jgi:hypothetical protein
VVLNLGCGLDCAGGGPGLQVLVGLVEMY